MDLFPKHSELQRAVKRGDANIVKVLLDELTEWAKNLNLDRSLLYVDYIARAIDYKNIGILLIILRTIKLQLNNNCGAHLFFTPSDLSYNFVERALSSENWDCAKLLVYFSQNFKQKNILATLDRLLNAPKVDITPSNEDWYKYLDAMVQKRKKSNVDLSTPLDRYTLREWRQRVFVAEIFRLYIKAYQQGILTFKLMQCKLQSAYAFLYKIENESNEYLDPKHNRVYYGLPKKEVNKIKCVGPIGDTCFPIDALPSDLLNLLLKELMPRDIIALCFVSKGTLKALDHMDGHYHIWKSLYSSQKYHVFDEENSQKIDWRRLVVKEDRIRSNWSKGKYEVNYLTGVNRQANIFLSNEDWMLFKPDATTKANNMMLWNCEELRMWSIYSGVPNAKSAVFVDEGAYNKPPIISVSIGLPDQIVMLKDQEQISMQIRLPPTSANGLEDIFCCANNKIYSQYGYMDIESEVFVDVLKTLNLLKIKNNMFNEQIMYGLDENQVWLLMDNRDNMNVVQRIEVDGDVTFVDEHLFLCNLTDVRRSPKITLYDIRMPDYNTFIAEVSHTSHEPKPLNLSIKNYRLALEHNMNVGIYRSNTLEMEGKWLYEEGLDAINGRYAIASADGRTAALDFAF